MTSTSSRTNIRQDAFVQRSPFYYGWFVWLMGTLALSASMPGQTASISLFIDRWIADFGLDDRSTISALYGIGTFIASLSLTFIGNRMDRYGARVVGVVAALVFAVALVYMSFVNGLVMLAIGFFLIRLLGQGALSLISITVVAKWFQRLRGRVVALALIGFGVFQRLYLPFVQGLLERFAWQQVWLMLAAVIALVVAPLIYVFMRETPERFGLLPDGDEQPVQTEGQPTLPRDDDSYTLREAMRTVVFWVFLVGGMMAPAFITAITFHQESIFTEVGFDSVAATAAVANALLISAFVTLPIGWLLDNIRPGLVRTFELAALIGVLLLTNVIANSTSLLLWSVLFGTVMGIQGVFNGTVWANLFGRQHLGEIKGFVTTTGVIGTAVGPIILASSFDLTGGYTTALYISAAITALPMLVAPFMTNPRKQAQR
jgi:MFS transporter, OFA family, oxalate/formate antiporter